VIRALIASAALALLCLGHAAELAVALRPEARLRTAHATLADVADVTGDAELVAATAGLAIQDLPDLATYTIDAAKVRAAIGKRVPARSLTVTGACALSRATLTVPAEDLAGAVRAHLAAAHVGEQDVTIVRASGALVVADDAAEPIALVAEPLAKAEAGELPYRVRVMRSGRELDRGLVVARLRLYRSVPVAARAIAQGESLSAGDIRMERVEVGVGEVPAGDGIEAMVGQVAVRDIADGAVLSARLCRSRPSVRAGERIALVYQSGGFELVADGTALADAGPGEVIQARREHDRKLIEARVIADGRALINFE